MRAALLTLHFFLLACGMLKIWLPAQSLRVGQVVYARLTGAGGTFGFFSPNAPRDVQLVFGIEKKNGERFLTTLDQEAGSEVRARLVNMTGLLGNEFKHEKVVRSIAASLSAAMFRKYPEARYVTLSANFVNFPDLEDYRKGKRPELLNVYTAKFANGAN